MAGPDIQKKDLEKVLGDEFSAEAIERIRFIQAVATWDVTDRGSTTYRDLIVVRPNRCDPTSLVDVSGVASTGSDATRQLRLSDFTCLTDLHFQHPINVVATPLSSTPCFVTLSHTLVNDGEDVEIQVWSWDSGGDPAPAVSFDWRCRVATRFGGIILRQEQRSE
jgi:hypothetical protein